MKVGIITQDCYKNVYRNVRFGNAITNHEAFDLLQFKFAQCDGFSSPRATELKCHFSSDLLSEQREGLAGLD